MVMALSVLACTAAMGQNDSTLTDTVPAPAVVGRFGDFVCIPDNPPRLFKGGDRELMEWVLSRIKYPPAIEDHEENRYLVVGFLITATGEVNPDSVKVLRVSKGLEPEYVEQAVSVIKSLPKFTPAYSFILHKRVGVWVTMPIKYNHKPKKKE